MNKNLEELKKDGKDTQYFDGLGVGIFIMYYLVPILEDFDKRLKKAEDGQNRKISGPIITKIDGIDPN